GQRLSAAREPYRLPLNRRLRRCLLRNEQPLIGLRQSPRHSSIGSLLLRLGLSYLKRAQVQRLLLCKNGLPCQVLAQRLFKVLQPYLICREKDQRVPIEPRCVTTRIQDRPRRCFSRVTRLPAVGVLRR